MNKMVATLAAVAGLKVEELNNSRCVVRTEGETVIAAPNTVTVYTHSSWRNFLKDQAQDLHDYLSVEWGIEEAYYD